MSKSSLTSQYLGKPLKYCTMKVHRNHYLLFIIVITLYGCKIHQQRTKSKDNTNIQSNENIIHNALTAFGMPSATVIESRVTQEQQIPCIQSAGSVSQVRIDTPPLIIKVNGKQLTNSFIRSWDLFYSPQSKQLIKAVSI